MFYQYSRLAYINNSEEKLEATQKTKGPPRLTWNHLSIPGNIAWTAGDMQKICIQRRHIQQAIVQQYPLLGMPADQEATGNTGLLRQILT